MQRPAGFEWANRYGIIWNDDVDRFYNLRKKRANEKNQQKQMIWKYSSKLAMKLPWCQKSETVLSMDRFNAYVTVQFDLFCVCLLSMLLLYVHKTYVRSVRLLWSCL